MLQFLNCFHFKPFGSVCKMNFCSILIWNKFLITNQWSIKLSEVRHLEKNFEKCFHTWKFGSLQFLKNLKRNSKFLINCRMICIFLRFGIISKFSCGGCNITCYGKAPFFRRVLHLYISALTGKGVENSVIKEMRFFHEILSCNFSVLAFLKKWLLSWLYEE